MFFYPRGKESALAEMEPIRWPICDIGANGRRNQKLPDEPQP
jgi:hypothetical protein